jgi:superoxide reductase
MNRRQFFTLAAAGTATSIIAPQTVLASHHSSMAGGLYFTKEAPGRWAKKAGGHIPKVEVSGSDVHVLTPHGMKDYKHYIVKHIILDADYAFIAEKVFDPTVDNIASSDFSLGSYKGDIHVLSVCNLHDTWVADATV